ncbi:hypothetical protein [Pectobacterium peruviense]|uniref:Uncharacterized protein n=1 Tax=Pectobacterium peruviense TaxID=2066479 RepID=A0ABX4SEW8_9GAMM|nr:hypothetical protein [Pectobacterium peruviense]KML67182.1 hypothetical protein G033_10690 [Pectobacterium peruviense]PKX81584.1 hypothetical protein A0G02_03320 [Pectobacterium peruviense]PKX88010.1 hypothetical protein A0G03_02020 [Pectobacterium peruviense]
MTKSPHINNAINLSIIEGNSVKEISDGFEDLVTVVFFSKKISQQLCFEIKRQEPTLRYFSTARTPHNKADEGFICDEYKVAISYPK